MKTPNGAAHRLNQRHVTSSLWGKHFKRPGGVQILFRNLKDFLSRWRARDGLRLEQAHAFAHLGVGIGAGCCSSRHRRRWCWRSRLRFRLSSARPFASLHKPAQSFIGNLKLALLQQNLLNAAIASALPPGRSSVWGPEADTVSRKFTGKERDSESGLDYFGARYYGSALGRFTSPDWSSTPEPIPYASLSNPQSLNQYAYVGNNPLSITDLDGHGWWSDFWNGLANSTYRPLLTFVEHPIVTGRNLGSAITHPIATANAIKNGVVTTAFSAVKGDGTAIGTAVGTVGMVVIPGAGEAGGTAEAAADLGRVGEAGEAAANAGKALASDLQVQEVMSGAGTPLAGAGTGTTLRDANRLAATYGGEPGDWAKVGSSNVTPAGASGGFDKAGFNGGFEVHAYQNVKTGQVVELKTKFQ